MPQLCCGGSGNGLGLINTPERPMHTAPVIGMREHQNRRGTACCARNLRLRKQAGTACRAPTSDKLGPTSSTEIRQAVGGVARIRSGLPRHSADAECLAMTR